MNRPAAFDIEATRLALLKLLERQPQLSQRQLSHLLGLSLGKTHYMLHALLDKGLIKVRNFKRSDQKMAYVYLLTPTGVREKFRLTGEFLARKEAEYRELQTLIADLKQELAAHSESCIPTEMH